jgi:cytochrome c-type biogenesis protein CcmF
LLLATGLGGLGTVAALAAGVRHPIALAVTWPAVAAIAAPVLALSLDARRRNQTRFWAGVFRALKGNRRQYAAYLIHAGFVCLALGVAGSSLGTRRHEAVLHEGETLSWAGRSIRLAGLAQHAFCDKVVVEARLEVSQGDACCTLLPAQHLYRLQNEWTTEVAIHSTWTGDFYAILHGGEGLAKASFTFVENPMMRWIWLGGWVAGFGALVGLLPSGRRAPERSVIAGPHWAAPATRTGKTASSGHHVSHP